MDIARESIPEVSRKTKTALSAIKVWLVNEEINTDKEYALKYKEEHPWLGMKKNGFKEVDPNPEGIDEVTTTDPVELKKESKDLRKKIAYVEGKVRYFETLYEHIGTKPSEVSKKMIQGNPDYKRRRCRGKYKELDVSKVSIYAC